MRVALALTLLASVAVSGQQSEEPVSLPTDAAFEVASVKPNKSGSFSSSTQSRPNGSYTATNETLRSAIANAYSVRSFQITGGPRWIDSDRFDIIARSREGIPQNQLPAMLRTLLAERFKLVVHMETRDQPVYALVVARPDAKLGPTITPSTLICSGPNAVKPQPGAPSPCGLNTSVSNRLGTMTGGGQSMDDIAKAIANFAVEQAVINRTGIDGAFDYELRFTPARLASSTGSEPPPDAPSIFTALQEQLGLRLESSRGPVEFIVIDSVEQPTPD